MREPFIDSFLTRFFAENDCTVTRLEPGILEVQLSISMDKALMNRPFYWNYMESTNQIGTPMTLTLITDKDKRDQKGEWIPYGSPRLQQINEYLKDQARFTRLFQVINTNQNTMLQPWLLTNYSVSYEGKQKKEELFSIGLNLINGVMVLDMMDNLSTIDLSSVISNHCYTISPLIRLNSGYLRIEGYIENYISKLEHRWAIDSYRQLEQELQMIHYFYQDHDTAKDKEREIDAVTKRLSPSISQNVISGGIFYLDQHFLSGEIKKTSTTM